MAKVILKTASRETTVSRNTVRTAIRKVMEKNVASSATVRVVQAKKTMIKGSPGKGK